MLYANKDDIERCVKIVKSQLSKANVNVDEKVLKKITEDIMNISYSKGGSYTDNVIERFSETYIKDGFYKKFLKD